MYLSHLDSTYREERFDLRRGLEVVFLHVCYMRNTICPVPNLINKSRSLMTPSDDGPYLNAVLIVLLRPDWGRPHLMIVDVIT